MDTDTPVRFAAACGAATPLDLVIEKDIGEVVTRGTVDLPCAMIGRDQYCEIVLNDTAVSARHAFLQVIGGRVFVADLDSRAGTRWDDRPRPDGWLTPDAPIQMGPFRLHLTAPVSDTPTRFGPSFHPFQAGLLPVGYPKAVIEFRNGRVAQSRWEINRVLTLVGRARSCKINLASDEVSLFHGYFLHTPDGVWVVDLYGRGGVLVNGDPVRYRRLNHGDEVRVAKFELGVAYVDEPRTPPAPALPVDAPLGVAYADVRTGFPDVLAQPETVPPVTLFPATPRPAEPSQALVAQFAIVQHQMFQQFQQSLAVMMWTFGQAHQQQIAAMEQEMAKLAALTEEVQKLEAQLGRKAEQPPLTPPPDPGRFPAATAESAEVHGQVFDRIAALNSERQGVWQRLMGLVSAKSPGG